jgi:hypothetical protein
MRKFLVLLVAIILAGCSVPTPDPVIIQQIVKETQAAMPTQTAYSTYTPYPTYTVQPIFTPIVITKVVTPTNTLTPTLTPSPVFTATATATTVPLSSYTTNEDQIASFLQNPISSIGQTFKVLLETGSSSVYIDGKNETLVHYAAFPKTQRFYIMLAIEDELSDETVDLQKNQYSWAYGVIIGTVKYSSVKESKYYTPNYFEMPKVRIIHQEPIDQMKWPKHDGNYMVNRDIAPGPWYSSYSMTVDGCYWARINSSGNIIDNHYGVAGITVYVAPTDTVVQFDGCGKMYYIGD